MKSQISLIIAVLACICIGVIPLQAGDLKSNQMARSASKVKGNYVQGVEMKNRLARRQENSFSSTLATDGTATMRESNETNNAKGASGLVSRMNQAGIHSIADLGHANPERLSKQVGIPPDGARALVDQAARDMTTDMGERTFDDYLGSIAPKMMRPDGTCIFCDGPASVKAPSDRAGAGSRAAKRFDPVVEVAPGRPARQSTARQGIAIDTTSGGVKGPSTASDKIGQPAAVTANNAPGRSTASDKIGQPPVNKAFRINSHVQSFKQGEGIGYSPVDTVRSPVVPRVVMPNNVAPREVVPHGTVPKIIRPKIDAPKIRKPLVAAPRVARPRITPPKVKPRVAPPKVRPVKAPPPRVRPIKPPPRPKI